MKSSKIKTYTVGGNWDDGHWIDGHKRKWLQSNADVVIFPGGADINPAIYKEPIGALTGSPYFHRDSIEIEAYNQAIKAGQMIIGICRGFFRI